MKKLLIKALAFLPLILIMPALALYVNPENEFNMESYSSGIASHLLKHENVTGNINYEKRIILKHYISGLKKAPDAMVLGSSRGKLIDSTFFSDSNISVLNCSVNYGTFNDILAIYDMMAAKNWHPKQVVLSIDPYFFNDNNQLDLYGLVWNNYTDMCNILGIKPSAENELKIRYGFYEDLFNPVYFQKSLLYLTSNGNNHKYTITKNKYNDKKTLMYNGVFSYGIIDRQLSLAAINEKAPPFVTDQAYKDFTEISSSISLKFEKFIDYLKMNGTDVYILYSPYHPICYKMMSEGAEYKKVMAVEQYCRRVALEKHVPFFGTLNPTALGLSGIDFYDGAHLKEEGLKKFFKPGGKQQ